MAILLPPNRQQFALFLPTQDLITKFYDLFKLVYELDTRVTAIEGRVTAIENLLILLQKDITYDLQLVTNPVSGSTVVVNMNDENTWVEISAAANIAALTVQLPGLGVARGGQQTLTTSNRTINGINFTCPGSIISGIPGSISPDGGGITYKYSISENTWYLL